MNAIDNGEWLARLLRDAPVPPITTDLERALVAGRRGERVRRYATVTGSGLAATAVLVGATVGVGYLRHPALVGSGRPAASMSASASTSMNPSLPALPGEEATTPPNPKARPAWAVGLAQCTITKLPAPPAGMTIETTAGDPTGRYLGVRGFRGGNYNDFVPLLWTTGVGPAALTPQAGTGNMAAINIGAINQRGEVVAGNQVYRNGKGSLLPGLAGYSTEAFGINSAGDVVGEGYKANGSSYVALLWPATGGIRVLPSGGKPAFAGGIADDGTIVGWVDHQPYVWQARGGGGHALPLPAGALGGGAAVIRGDWVGGGVRTKDSGTDGFATDEYATRWNLRTGEVTMYPGVPGWVKDVNARGDLLVTDLPNRITTFIRDGRPLALPTLSTKYGYPMGVSLTDNGDIGGMLASGVPLADPAIPVYWHCG
ncbi:MAG: hypothetical protein J2P15_20185 [Micromonosporaceae bacterium]|nr:hypothetical protein [Micromonosporaceae bacterium]